MVEAFQQRRDVVVKGLNAIEGIRCQNPRGAFYVFPNIRGVCRNLGVLDALQSLPPDIKKKTTPSTLFQMFLLYEHQVATLDRKSFGRIGIENLHFLRLSVATDMDSLREGVKRIAAASHDKKGFETFFKRGEHLY
jgi:aspartate aminotransferase